MDNATSTGQNVFVKDPNFVWLPATVIETDGSDRVKVQICLTPGWGESTSTRTNSKRSKLDKSERWIDLNDYHNHQLPIQNSKSVRDIAELPHLHAPAILYQIRARHAAEKPYTRVGEIIIAVNPCRWIEGLYNEELQRLYAKRFVWQVGNEEGVKEDKSSENVATSSTSFESFYDRLGHEPHIYEVSASAYRGLALEGINQTVLVSGESGAGKTETVKLVLRHLSKIDMATLSADKALHDKVTEAKIKYVVDSSPVFEAFGNAKTCSNHNSSRFGKVTHMHFSPGSVGMFSLIGSSFDTCLLETSRVVYHSPSERSFHIFYQFLSASQEFKSEHLGDEWADACVTDFRYLVDDEMDANLNTVDGTMWEKTLRALQLFKWEGDALRTLLGGLGVILRLGNLSFGELSEGEAHITSSEELNDLSKIIGIPSREIEKAMTRRSLRTRQEELCVPLSCETAKEGCDALAKKLYCRIFASIVRAINKQTASPSTCQENGTISLIDIFGFERFVVNRFEQLCINYTNEKLQYKYVQDNLQRHIAEYEREGLQLFDMDQFDNSNIVELLEGSKGLINALTEESVVPNGNNASFVFKIKRVHKINEHLIDEKLHMKTEFGIHHFAGPVIYDASEFIERNSDKLPDSLLHLASKSSNPLISKEFCGLVRAQETDDSTDTSRKAKQNTVMERFRSQLRTLLDEMSETHVRYIRCIKPSGEMKPSHVDNKTVMRQLTCAGLVTAIEITRETFPNKLTFKVAIERFRCLLDCGRQQLMIDMEPHEKCQFMMTALFAPEIEKFNSSHFTMPFACGKTKVFYRAGSLEILEMARHNFLSAKATRIQAFVRKLLSYEEFDRSRKAIICLQSFVRQVKAHAIFMREIRAIICLQAYTRRWSRRLRREARQIDLVSSESHFATTICSWYRARHSRKAYKQTLRCVVVLQACFRSKRVTDLIMIRRGAVFAIEAWYLKARSKGKLQTYQKTACPQPYNGIPTVVEFCESASPSDTLEELHDETRSVPLVEKVPVNVGQDLIEEQLMRELQNEKFKVDNLEKEIDQMRTDAELHAQEIEADFEERVNGYEDEVLVLKRTIAKMEDDSRKLTEETEAAEEAHKKNVQRLQFEIRKIQGSHRDYLDKIMALLDDTETAQKLQTSRIREEMEAIKRERDIQVNSLKDEIKLLRSIGFGTRKNKLDLSDKAQRLSRKLYAILSPDNVLLLASEAQQQDSKAQLYIEEKFSSKARNLISYLGEIVSVAEYEVHDIKNRHFETKDRLHALQQQLVCAYEEIEYTKESQLYH